MSRQLLGLAGIAIAVVGIALDSVVVIWLAITVLSAAALWRLLARRAARQKAEAASSWEDGREKD